MSNESFIDNCHPEPIYRNTAFEYAIIVEDDDHSIVPIDGSFKFTLVIASKKADMTFDSPVYQNNSPTVNLATSEVVFDMSKTDTALLTAGKIYHICIFMQQGSYDPYLIEIKKVISNDTPTLS